MSEAAPDLPAVCERCKEPLVVLLGTPTCMRGVVTDIEPLVTERLPMTRDGIESAFPELSQIEWIGAGGMGNVYRAVETSYGRQVILKISNSSSLDATMADRLGAETRALADLHHSNILHFYHGGLTSGGNAYVVTEYVEGDTLAERLQQQGPLEEAETLQVARQLCEALNYAHGRGILHRDLKPGNVMFGEDDAVRIIDFGLAAVGLEEREGGLGTAYYVAPEQRRGDPTDARADVFSLGILLHETLTGDVPSPGSAMVPSRRPGVSRRWDRILRKAVMERPEDRYDSVAALWEVIERAFVRTGLARWQKVALLGMAAVAAGGVLWATVRSGLQGDGARSVDAWGDPAEATSSNPWFNSLDMPLVPLQGTEVLIAVYPTRVGDYRVFAESSGHDITTESVPMHVLGELGWKPGVNQNWENPGFPQTEAHPVCGVSWDDAKGFCAWLTLREKQEGRLRAFHRYRLPTDAEWSLAAGLGEESGETPQERFNAAAGLRFPWGKEWPPEGRFGNYGSVESRSHRWPGWEVVKDYEDGYARTAPVGSFPANAMGLHDLSGNVCEWCEDWWAPDVRHKVLRGGSWMSATAESLSLYHRDRDAPENRYDHRGFRVVLGRGN